jgi:hypothetical protein
MIFVIYLMSTLGICYAWSDTEVSVPLRNYVARLPFLRKVLLCHECSSFWISLAISFLINPAEEYCFPIISNFLSAFCGFFINLFFVRNNKIPSN